MIFHEFGKDRLNTLQAGMQHILGIEAMVPPNIDQPFVGGEISDAFVHFTERMGQLDQSCFAAVVFCQAVPNVPYG